MMMMINPGESLYSEEQVRWPKDFRQAKKEKDVDTPQP